MGRLKAMPSRLGALPPRLGAAPNSERQRSRDRDATQEWRRWYKTARWQRLRKSVLVRDGYRCQQTGALLVGKYPAPNSPVADHKMPHRGDPELFWDIDNIEAVSKEYHDRDKQRFEKRGLV